MNKRIERGEEHRNEARVSRELDSRDRDPFYYLPAGEDLGAWPVQSGRAIQLVAPPPRIDPSHGKMMQRWVNVEAKNGTRQHELMEQGWRVRDPLTVPASYQGRTVKWSNHDVIMVANNMLLMEIPEKLYQRSVAAKMRENKQLIDDIRAKHNDVMRDGEIVGKNSAIGGSFAQTQYVQPQSADGSGREVAFAE